MTCNYSCSTKLGMKINNFLMDRGERNVLMKTSPLLPTGLACIQNSYVKTDDRDRYYQAKCQKSSQKVLEQIPGVVSQLGL